MEKELTINNNIICKARMLAIRDAMDLLSGKWKLHILGTLLQVEKLRFMELLREVDGIASKMLSKELQDMEMNHLIHRRVLNTKPSSVEYEVTQFGKTLTPIINEIAVWGTAYRNAISKKIS